MALQRLRWLSGGAPPVVLQDFRNSNTDLHASHAPHNFEGRETWPPVVSAAPRKRFYCTSNLQPPHCTGPPTEVSFYAFWGGVSRYITKENIKHWTRYLKEKYVAHRSSDKQWLSDFRTEYHHLLWPALTQYSFFHNTLIAESIKSESVLIMQKWHRLDILVFLTFDFALHWLDRLIVTWTHPDERVRRLLQVLGRALLRHCQSFLVDSAGVG